MWRGDPAPMVGSGHCAHNPSLAGPLRQAAWSTRTLPTFSDTLTFVRQHLWPSTFFCLSSSEHEVVNIPQALFDRFVDTLAFVS